MLALVVGSAACVWDDVRTAKELCKFDAVCCVKRAGIAWPDKFDVWATLHPEFMDDYEARRKAAGLPGGYEIVAPPESELGTAGMGRNIPRRVSYCWPEMDRSPGSGIYGIKVMLEAGYRVVAAGIPMNNEPHFLKHELWGNGTWDGLANFESGFKQAIPHMMDKVRSMSGRTQEILGGVSPEWLAEG